MSRIAYLTSTYVKAQQILIPKENRSLKVVFVLSGDLLMFVFPPATLTMAKPQ